MIEQHHDVEAAESLGSPQSIIATGPPERPPRRRPRRSVVLAVGVVVVTLALVGGGRLLRSTGDGGAVATRPTPVLTASGNDARPGIDVPVDVAGTPVRIVSVTRQGSYSTGPRFGFGSDSVRPRSANDDLLVVEVETGDSGQQSGSEEGRLAATVVDEHGRSERAGIVSLAFSPTDLDRRTVETTEVFIVSRASRSFVLRYPSGASIDIGPIVRPGGPARDPAVLASEDFDGPSIWPTVSEGPWAAGVADGVFRVRGPGGPTGRRIVVPGSRSPSEVRIEVLVRAEQSKATAGLTCRDDGRDQFYRAVIEPNGRWSIVKASGTDEAATVVLLATGSSAVRLAPGAVRLAFECEGGRDAGEAVTLRILAEDQPLGEAVDAEGLAPGTVAVVVIPTGGGATVAFDDVRVAAL